MKKSMFVTAILLIICNLSISQIQNPEKPRLIDKLVFGGNFGLRLGAITHIDISPSVGYKINERTILGIGAIYQYYKDDRIYYISGQTYPMDYETNIYGGRIFSQYLLIEEMGQFLPIDFGSIILHAEYEFINIDIEDSNSTLIEFERRWVSSLLIGAGLKQRIGKRSSVNLLLLWNLNEHAYSPYSNPVVRLGFSF
ncbi:MAG: hypothetical protein HN704_14990 [Bacteroidetes bacterium]|nr:hypothetical protein [Bacteroidota bacterium]MBT6686133.1 hypothetical protein [Bacteroidota bacterium]MBT7144648.1 hypothetical protein [Bacteroidota bacterium]MBT7492903.1 hypothetical protein [Bacteroidota bacterium]